MKVLVQEADFDPQALADAMTNMRVDAGALTTFTGFVRGGDGLKAMTLEHYPAMTQKALEKIAHEAMTRWPLLDVTVVHRYGRLQPGERIVFVATLSAHRKAAFEAAEFLMDWLKTKAPFWKLEEGADGEHWVDAKAADDDAAKRWE